ncbi:MAG: metallophosphoesterase family protein [Promethearchaeota archaeon]
MKENHNILLLKPNLGQPHLINLNEIIEKQALEPGTNLFFEAIFFLEKPCKKEDLEKILLNHCYLQPLLKDTGDFNARRGSLIPLKILEINNPCIEDIKKLRKNEKEVILHDIYLNLNKLLEKPIKQDTLHVVKFGILNLLSIKTLLKQEQRACLLFDIVIKIPTFTTPIINYHALAIFNKEWKNFSFIHATDLHVARRNDFISIHLKNEANNKFKNKKSCLSTKNSPSISCRDFEIKIGFQENEYNQLKQAKYNFNYNLRKFIRFVNERIKDNELDFVVFTGDLVDYIEIAMGNDQYLNNYHVFTSILLGINMKKDSSSQFSQEEYQNQHEILAPIFTTTGNHDYRIGHYSLHFGNICKIFGMTKEDIKNYHDLKFFSYYSTVRSNIKYMKYYLEKINPNLNYSFKFGKKFLFICLDTGQDEKKNLYNLFRGVPKSKGLSDHQIQFIREVLSLNENKNIVFFMHAPPLSPMKNYYKLKKLRKLLKASQNVKWSELYENNLKKIKGTGHLNDLLHFNHQTIKNNRESFLKLCLGLNLKTNNKIDLILCGHDHSLKEFRLEPNTHPPTISKEKEDKSTFFNIFTQNYRKIINSMKDHDRLENYFKNNRPFLFQTQALGPISNKFLKFKPPGFRLFKVKENILYEIDVYSFHLITKKR